MDSLPPQCDYEMVAYWIRMQPGPLRTACWLSPSCPTTVDGVGRLVPTWGKEVRTNLTQTQVQFFLMDIADRERLTSLQKRKLQARFRLLDRDSDGMLVAGDYSGLAADMADSLGLGTHDPARQAAMDVCTTLFDRMLARLDEAGTGQISEPQFLASLARSLVARPDRFEEIIGPMCRVTFDIGDRDGDDRIDRVEFCALMTAGRVPAEQAAIAFDKMAPWPRADDRMTREQFHTGCREFYCSPDPQAGGNWMYGSF